ncbi:MAG TPA: hypothetical protein ENN81_00120, partial [Phycisphaerales bacterium]|nr:hypothetical protein [Phycisphaerales bacterium]
VPLAEYRQKLREVIQKCLDNGTLVILTTIPPAHGLADKSVEYARAQREIAKQMKVPLIDYQAAILERRPTDWDGAMEKFAAYDGYDVPTLICRDGIHPSNPRNWADDYSPEGLAHNGYVLRNYLTLAKYAEVLRKAGIAGEPAVPEKPEPQAKALIEPPNAPWWPKAPALGKPTGDVVEVSTVEDFERALESAKPGQTILLADGHYMMRRYVEVRTDGVTIRGASGRREAVVIDGADSRHRELIGFRNCKDVMVADLTIQNTLYNGFKINSETDVQRLTIRNCIIHNIWQRGVKGVKVPVDQRDRIAPRGCRVEYCLFYNDRAKRKDDDAHDIAGGNYIGGIDVMFAEGWTISDNVFVGIQGSTREGRGAIFVWHDSRDCIIERNIIIDCDAGVCLGNPHRPDDVTVHCTECIVRNNFVTAAPQGGITMVYTKDCRVLHNTVHEKPSKWGRLIRMVFDNDGLVVRGNLLSGPGIRNESDSAMVIADNAIGDFSDLFVDVAAGNLHLRRADERVAGRLTPLAGVDEDIDRQPRGRTCDIGADALVE